MFLFSYKSNLPALKEKTVTFRLRSVHIVTHCTTMITARLSKELELRAGLTAKALQLTVSDLIRIGIIRVLDEYQQTGAIEVRSSIEPIETKEDSAQ